jgi:RNA polymerase sigma-70 factor (ECF subfamily)
VTDDNAWVVSRFEEERAYLRSVAYRMLGSLTDADDVVQEAWLRLNRSQPANVENLRAWLTTVVARLCLNVLRARAVRREDSLEAALPRWGPRSDLANAEEEAVLADSVGLALLVVLERLAPPERLAFVLHDMFDLPFDEIAPIVGRTPQAARQLASRARRRVRGGSVVHGDQQIQRQIVAAFLAASRRGDFHALVELLDPEVVLRADGGRRGAPTVVRGAPTVIARAQKFSRFAAFCQVALIDGEPGIVIAPHGRLLSVLRVVVRASKIVEINIIAEPARLRQLALAVPRD